MNMTTVFRLRYVLIVAAVVAAISAIAACSGEPSRPTPLETIHAPSFPDVDSTLEYTEQEALLADLYVRVVPSVVRIVSDAGEGSGFVWDREGHIVTNFHLVGARDTQRITFHDGYEYDAALVGVDHDSDIAVLKIDAPADSLVPVTPGNSGALRPGQFAIAIGNPFGQEFTMTTGIVSAVGRLIGSGFSDFAIPEVIQTDAAINPGNSGGPLFDSQGRVIGINSQIRSDSRQFSGVGFAVPIDLARRVVPSLIQDGEHRYSWLGISAFDVNMDLRREASLDRGLRGTLVQTVSPNSPAERAGLQAGDRQITVLGRPVTVGGDIIVSIEGNPVMALEDVIAYLALNTSPGDTVTVGIRRDGELIDLDVELGERPL